MVCMCAYFLLSPNLEFISLTVGAIVLPTGSFRESLPLVLSDVECDGNESSILSCTFNTTHIQCDSGEGAAIICQGIYVF